MDFYIYVLHFFFSFLKWWSTQMTIFLCIFQWFLKELLGILYNTYKRLSIISIYTRILILKFIKYERGKESQNIFKENYSLQWMCLDGLLFYFAILKTNFDYSGRARNITSFHQMEHYLPSLCHSLSFFLFLSFSLFFFF